ncbi:MAG TPA: protein kinase [Candidatus Saccharimonadales bacterium]|jgi:serine/threonine protein kinase/tetratricopeptide (TPR) repeat protein|nr:protein kinase [Candidatus Saccharimonadales bacterium]
MERSAEHDERVMTIVAAALRMPMPERDSFLHIACQEDTELYQEAEKVMEWEERMGNFLREPLIDFIDLEDSVRPFEAGEVISERFEIMHEVGRGGMGVVYEAFDRKRNQRIAIKCALPGFGRLLSPELEGALKVRHPNICLVNEIHTAPTASGEVDFLTMEFLDGETLSARLTAKENFTSKDVLEIARQLCGGLAEAHRSGVIHRDLKSANVILTRGKDARMRAVVTDFGLARDATLDCEDFGGTPRYIAPELWRGEKASKASDIYALGVILYELVTGQPPHEGSSTNEAPTSDPVAPSTRNNDLDVRWNKAILPCLAASPAARPDATQVLAVFDKRPILRSQVLTMAVAAMVVLGTGLYRPVRELLKPADIRLAILPVQAPTELTEMGTGVLQDVADRIRRSQRGGAAVVVFPPSEAPDNNVHSPEEAWNALHATHALQLNLTREGNTVVAEEAVIELASHTHMHDSTGRYTITTLGDMPTALTGAVTSTLRLRTADSDSISPAATASYDRGLYFLRQDQYSYDKAIAQFQEATRLDPHSPLPLAGLVEAQVGKFKFTKEQWHLEDARQVLQEAEALNPDSVTVRLAAGLLNETTGQSEKALEDYRRAQQLEPRNVDARIRMGHMYEALNMPDRALENYRNAIKLQPEYYKGYEWLATFYFYGGKYAEAAEQFQKAIDRAPGRYSPYFNLGAVLDVLGRDDEALTALRKSLALKKTALALNSLGVIMAYQWHDNDAAGYYQQAVEMEPGNYKYRLNLGDSYRRLGRRWDAMMSYRKGKELALAELQQNPRLGATRAFVAYFKARVGDRAGAEEEIAEALHLSPGDAQALRCAILVYEALGQRDRALKIARGAPPNVLHELLRHHDLADFCRDPRFVELSATKKGG